jgi:aconitate hydratase
MDMTLPQATLQVGGKTFRHVDLLAAGRAAGVAVDRLPVTFRILLENILRHRQPGDDRDLAAMRGWLDSRAREQDISFYPARVLMPDSSGVPLLADLAAMRDAVRDAGGDASCVNPHTQVDLVVDHSVVTDHAGQAGAIDLNVALEYLRNGERYRFLKWAQSAFTGLRLVPPSTGIVHQVNLEYLAQVVAVAVAPEGGPPWAFPDTLVGMDSHTSMVNALGVLGWGVGGIEAGAVMLGQPVSLLLPRVVGCEVTGRLRPGVSSTDLALTLTERLRKHQVVGQFVEFFGAGLDQLPVSCRATLANMAPESGATMSFFPVDQATLDYLTATGRDAKDVERVAAVTRTQALWRPADPAAIAFSDRLVFDLDSVRPSMAGPKRPQDRVDLAQVPSRFATSFEQRLGGWKPVAAAVDITLDQVSQAAGERPLDHGDIVIAAITSCTNTANPQAMMAAGLLARKLTTRGVTVPPWVKTSLSPGSRVVTDYLQAAGLQPHLDALGFHLTGYGCMTCAGGSGELDPGVAAQVRERDLVVAAVLSSNRNFEGRTHPLVRAGFLGSPALVVAYACAGSVARDLTREPISLDCDGAPVWLADVWPSDEEINAAVRDCVFPGLFSSRYASVFDGDQRWQELQAPSGLHYPWEPASTYLRRPPYFDALPCGPAQASIVAARALLMLGDSVTTDHISPTHAIAPDSESGRYLASLGVAEADYSTLLARRGNHEVMLRGTFANPRLTNEMTPGHEGAWTRHWPDGQLMSIYEAARRYREVRVPMVVVAGSEYGTGSSRDWAAKGVALLGVRAVIAESFERIHRSNLAGMGVLPLQFPAGVTRRSLGLTGEETFSIGGLDGDLIPGKPLECEVSRRDGSRTIVRLLCRLDIPREVDWWSHGGILPYVLASLLGSKEARPAV